MGPGFTVGPDDEPVDTASIDAQHLNPFRPSTGKTSAFSDELAKHIAATHLRVGARPTDHPHGVASFDHEFTDTADRKWRVDGTLIRPPGEPLGIADLTIRPYDPTSTVDTRVLREVPFTRIIRDSRRQLALIAKGIEARPLVSQPKDAHRKRAESVREVAAAKPAPKGGRPPVAQDDLRQVVDMVLLEQENGPGVNERAAARLGRPVSTLRTRLKQAETQGLIGPGRKGRAGRDRGPNY